MKGDIFMKKIIAVVLAIIMILSVAVMSSAATKKYKGDMNGDGAVSAIDAREALSLYISGNNPNYDQIVAADMNGDRKITAIDARMILRVAVGDLPLEEIKDSISWDDLIK